MLTISISTTLVDPVNCPAYQTGGVVDDNIRPPARRCNLHNIRSSREGVVTLGDVLQYRLLPLDINRAPVHLPAEDGPSVGHCGSQCDRQFFFVGSKGRRVCAPADDRSESSRIMTVGGDGGPSIRRKFVGGSLIAKDGCRVKIIAHTAQPAASQCCIEPVVTHRLGRLNNNIVTLANTEEELGFHNGINWHQVYGDDSEAVPDEGDREVILHRWIDKP